MSSQPRILYVCAKPETGGSVPGALEAGLTERLECCTPELLMDRPALSGYGAVIVDGHSLGVQSIEVAKRIRWLGIGEPVFLAWDSDTALDRAIAKECGVDEVVCGEGCWARLAAALASVVQTPQDQSPSRRPRWSRDYGVAAG